MNNQDRELLEAAARAAGYVVSRWTDDGTALLLEGIEQPWNSLHANLHSDCMGDALRLAVRLEMVPFLPCDYEPEEWRANPGAATRRAITRAAALAPQEVDHG